MKREENSSVNNHVSESDSDNHYISLSKKEIDLIDPRGILREIAVWSYSFEEGSARYLKLVGLFNEYLDLPADHKIIQETNERFRSKLKKIVER